MKTFIATLMLMFAASSYAADPAAVKAAEVAKADAAKQAVQNDNCVKKDKNGKCPPLPKSPKPTPKKKAEEVKKS